MYDLVIRDSQEKCIGTISKVCAISGITDSNLLKNFDKIMKIALTTINMMKYERSIRKC